MTPRQERIAVVTLAVVAALAVFGPELPYLASRFLGIEYVDHYGTLWFYWFTQRALVTGTGFGTTDLFFHPYGKDIYTHTGANVLDALAAIPFRVVLGPVLGYNVFVLTALVASAYAFSRLARDFVEDRVAVGVATVLFAVSPFVLAELQEGRPTQAILLLPVLFVRWLFRTGTTRGWRAPVLAGVLLAATGYQYWYYAFFGGLVALAHGLWRGLRPAPASGGRLRTLARHALVAVVAFVLVAPVAVPLYLRAEAGTDVPGLLATDTWTPTYAPPITAEGDAVGLFVWQPLRNIAGFYARSDLGSWQFLPHIMWFPTVAVLFLAVWIWRPGRLDRGPVIAMATMAAIVAIGPLFIIGDAFAPNPVYVLLAKHLGIVRRLWWPGRMFAYLDILLALTVAAAFEVAGRQGLRARVLATGAALLGWSYALSKDGLLPFPAWDATIPAGYKCLASGPPGAILELPYAWTQAHLYYQTLHGRPIFGGMIEDNPAFTPAGHEKLRSENGFVRSLISTTKLDRQDLEWTDAEAKAVYNLGYRYVVLQRDAYATAAAAETGQPGLADNAMKTRLRHMRRALQQKLGSPVYTDARVEIYAPWGDAAPCDPHDLVLDEENRLAQLETPAILNLASPDEVVIKPIISPPADAATSARKGAQAEPGGPAPDAGAGAAPPIEGAPEGEGAAMDPPGPRPGG